MPFVYNSILTRPNTGIAWFKDINPSAYELITSTVQSAPGYLSGIWEQDPVYPNRYLITHTWVDKAAWQAMSSKLQKLSATQLHNAYKIANNITVSVTLSQ